MAVAELTDVRCHYEILGHAEPLLLIHGLGVTCRSWDAVATELAGDFSLIMPDNRGVGRSTPKRPPHTLADLTSDLIELLDYLQIERAHVMGISLGGIIAQKLAVDHPSRIDRLVLVSCTHEFTPYLRRIIGLLGQVLRKFPAEMFARTFELLGPRRSLSIAMSNDLKIASGPSAGQPYRVLHSGDICAVCAAKIAKTIRDKSPPRHWSSPASTTH